ncbi:3-isopropylmalate dehydratase small subunit [Deferribacter autotrophicus]|uniref:3-isopropylmalate dehydratase n=1 Tax=Deferribacter autotrophicus TaxID=500465 RepID=A0A5A8F873_9BACT|nr:3-isopropylmalate dehydratase small subunit [Deferribacter autotrophicus]KAA0258542.1 3-isopropylmalate dehydratase small subunit [Deferribacter autotrophicus]
MNLGAIKKISGRIVPIVGDDIDTDRIIPARYLKCVTFDGLGEFVFYDERFDKNGKSLNHPIDNPKYKGANIILSGNNFGCGSSREHAPQAIKRAGFDAIIAESFAEIFLGNATTLGIVCITIPEEKIDEIKSIVEANPEAECHIDLENKTLNIDGKNYSFEIKETNRQAFLTGTYDSLFELLQNKDKVIKLEKSLPYRFV